MAPAAPVAPAAYVAPPPIRRVSRGSVNFLGMAALAATFAGFLSYERNPDVLKTGVAVVLTFFGTVLALYVLHFAFRVAVVALKVVIPVAVLLAVGCACDWPWAESTVDCLMAVGSKGAQVADQQWTEWRAR